MGIAFHILAHKNPAQVAALVASLEPGPDSPCVVHYDRARPPAEARELRRRLAGTPGVILQRRRPIDWGGWSIVAAQLEGLRLAMDASRSWTHWINLSGQDLPLVSPGELRHHLRSRPDLSHIEWFEPATAWPDWRDRLDFLYPNSYHLGRLLRLPGLGRRLRALLPDPNGTPSLPLFRRRPPFFRYLGSSNWVVLSRAAALSLLTDATAYRILRWLRWSGIPDESVFPSVVLNTRPALPVSRQTTRLIVFPPGTTSPRLLDSADLPRLAEAKAAGMLFARKFDLAAHPELGDAVADLRGAATTISARP